MVPSQQSFLRHSRNPFSIPFRNLVLTPMRRFPKPDAAGSGSGSGDLRRELTLLDSVMINVGSMVGSGIFLVPAAVALALQELRGDPVGDPCLLGG